MSSALGFPDWQRITQWFGTPLAKATAAAIGAGQIVVGPLNVRSFASIVVCVKPTGGTVTVTVTQSVPGGAASLVTASSFVVNDGNVIFEAFVMLAGAATVTFQGSAPGETIDYAIVPANTNTNAEVAALTQLGFQHNDLVVATETAIDLEDAAPIGWTFTDDPANLRMKITPTLRQNGAVTGSLYRWTGAAWSPTANVLVDDTAKQVALGTDLALYRFAATDLGVTGGNNPGISLYDQRDAAGAGGVLTFRAAVGAPGNIMARIVGAQVAAGSNVGKIDLNINLGVGTGTVARLGSTGFYIQIPAKAGIPTDADIPAGINAPSGDMLIVDETDSRLYVRFASGAWHYAPLT